MAIQRYGFHSLLHAADLLDHKLRKKLEPFGIRPRQARILNALDRIGPTSQSELIAEFDVTAGSMSSMIARLVSMNLVSRTRHLDELRTDVLQLTPDGLAKLEHIRAVWSEMQALIEEAIGKENTQQLTALTTELKFALGGKVPGQKRSRK